MLFSEWLERKGETPSEEFTKLFDDLQQDLKLMDEVLSNDNREYIRDDWKQYKYEMGIN